MGACTQSRSRIGACRSGSGGRAAMTRLKPVDVVIAGGGWAGLTMAKEIATRTSLSVVVLERGQKRGLKEYAEGMDEVDYGIRLRMMQNIAEETVIRTGTGRDKRRCQ